MLTAARSGRYPEPVTWSAEAGPSAIAGAPTRTERGRPENREGCAWPPMREETKATHNPAPRIRLNVASPRPCLQGAQQDRS